MIIYLVYEKDYADFENGEDDVVYINSAYKSKKKAIRKAKSLLKKAKNNKLYVDECISNKRNPFKTNNCVDFYKQEKDQEFRVSSIIIEETKLIA